MIRLLPFLLPMLAGCTLFSSGSASRLEAPGRDLREEAPHVPDVPAMHPFPVPRETEPGTWIDCRINGRPFTIVLAARKGDSVWMEFHEGKPTVSASARKIGPDGRVMEAWFRLLPDGDPRRQKLVQVPPVTGNRPGEREVGRSTKKETMMLGEKSCDVEVVTIVRENPDGLRNTEALWWSRQVPPLIGGSERGGLVRGEGVEVTDFGSGAPRKLIPPR